MSNEEVLKEAIRMLEACSDEENEGLANLYAKNIEKALEVAYEITMLFYKELIHLLRLDGIGSKEIVITKLKEEMEKLK